MTVTEIDLFLAILAMDSFNRKYGARLNDSGAGDQNGLGGQGSQIGNASVILDDVSKAARAVGFNAVAYSTPYGTVISYRGTDSAADSDLATDASHDWALGAGTRSSLPRTAHRLWFSPVPKYPRAAR